MKRNVRVLALASAAVLMPILGSAQTTAAVAPAVPERQILTGKMMAAAVSAKTTVGRPYSAEAVTESVQVLADGNRIVTRSASRVYRDGEGRTRREMMNPSGAVQGASISDPIARTSFTLEPETKTAYSATGVVTLTAAGGGGGGSGGAVPVEGQRLEAAVRARSSEPPAVVGGERVVAGAVTSAPAGAGGGVRMMKTPAPDDPNVRREELGQQMIEGVSATGTRTTTVIPAGAIGNAQEIRVVSEQWFSPDLQVLVMTKHVDPRSGENTYKLTNIVRAEPDPGLFVVPADYTVKVRGVRQPQ
jgi:hypothetical protein